MLPDLLNLLCPCFDRLLEEDYAAARSSEEEWQRLVAEYGEFTVGVWAEAWEQRLKQERTAFLKLRAEQGWVPAAAELSAEGEPVLERSGETHVVSGSPPGRVEDVAKQWRQFELEREKLWEGILALPEEQAKQAVIGALLALVLENANLVSELTGLGVNFSCDYDNDGARYQVALLPALTLTEDGAGAFAFLLGSVVCNSHAIWAVERATRPDWDTPCALVALRQALDEGPVVLAGLAQRHEQLAPLLEQREAASIASAGWADVHVRVFGHLRKALEGTTKQDELPSTTFLAWAERDPGEPLTGRGSTLSRISRLLAGVGTPEKELPVPRVRGTAEDELGAQEEARRQLRELAERAGLSPRESEVFTLRLQEYEEHEIAEKLGIAEGTVKSLWSRARQKLRAAAV